AEDGIRDFHVTGVQTCALPILPLYADGKAARTHHRDSLHRSVGRYSFHLKVSAETIDRLPVHGIDHDLARADDSGEARAWFHLRSEERRVGKGGRTREAP